MKNNQPWVDEWIGGLMQPRQWHVPDLPAEFETLLEGEVIDQKLDEDGRVVATVRTDDGRIITVIST